MLLPFNKEVWSGPVKRVFFLRGGGGGRGGGGQKYLSSRGGAWCL